MQLTNILSLALFATGSFATNEAEAAPQQTTSSLQKTTSSIALEEQPLTAVEENPAVTLTLEIKPPIPLTTAPSLTGRQVEVAEDAEPVTELPTQQKPPTAVGTASTLVVEVKPPIPLTTAPSLTGRAEAAEAVEDVQTETAVLDDVQTAVPPEMISATCLICKREDETATATGATQATTTAETKPPIPLTTAPSLTGRAEGAVERAVEDATVAAEDATVAAAEGATVDAEDVQIVTSTFVIEIKPVIPLTTALCLTNCKREETETLMTGEAVATASLMLEMKPPIPLTTAGSLTGRAVAPEVEAVATEAPTTLKTAYKG